MSPRRTLLIGALLWVCAPRMTAAQAMTLSEAQAVERALDVDPAIGMASASLAGAEADARGARYAFVPELALSGRYTRLSELDPSARTLDVGGAEFVLPQLLDVYAGRIELSVPLSDLASTAPLRLEAQDARAQAASARLDGARLATAAEARRRWVALALAEASEALLIEVEEGHRAWLEVVTERVAAGLTPEAERLEVLAQLLSVRRERVRAEAGRATASRSLAVFLGVSGPLTTTGLGPDLAPSEDAPRGARPALIALTEEERAARRGALAESLSALPRVSLFFGVDIAAPHPRAFAQTVLQPLATWDAGVAVSFSLDGALLASARADRLQADADALAAQRDEVERSLRLEEEDAEATLAAARTEYSVALEAVSAAEALAVIRRAQHTEGAIDAAALRTIELGLLRARLAALSSLADLHLARVRRDAARARSTDVSPEVPR